MKNYNDELNRTIDFIKFADSKIAYITTVFVVLFGFWLSKIDYLKNHTSPLNVVFYIVSTAIALGVIYFILNCVSPRLTSKNLTKKSLIYYSGINLLDVESYKKNRANIGDEELANLYLDQIYITSVIASLKMESVKIATWLTVIFGLFTAVLFTISS